MTGDMAEVPPPLPLYTFPRSQTPDAPPMTGFAHSLPVVRHRTSTGKGPSRRGGALREPLQDPRRGLLLAHWFGVRDREEAELSQAKLDREAKRRQAEMAALQLSHLGLAAAAGDGGPLSVEGVGVGDSDGPTAVQQTASAVAAFLAQQRDERESRRRDAQPPEPGEREPPSRRLVYDTADRDGLSVDRRDDDLEFDSWFESGNLRAAWRVEGRRQAGGRGDAHRPGLPSYADHEYDLLCNKDTHTNGHVQWFYFSVRRTDGLNVGPYEQPSPEAKRPLRVRLNIVNMMKKNSLYALGMLPVGFCERADARRGYGWTRVGEDVCYFRNTRTYPKRCRGPDVGKEGRFSGTTLDPTGAKESKNARHHYTLSFTVELASPLDAPRRGDSTSADDDSDSPGPVGPGEQSSDDAGRWRAAAKLGARVSPARRSSHGSPPKRSPKATRGQGDDRVFLAHCYPYTYSDLRRELQALDDRPGPSVVRRRRLCSTLAGNDCDLLTVTNFDTRDPRAVRDRAGVVLTARVHPGESNASFMMRGCVEFLTSNDPLAKQLREQFVFKIVPMMNPDGVINGNYRSSLAGEDLNRRYASPSATLQPTVHAVKQLLKATHEARGVIFYCDARRGNRARTSQRLRSRPSSARFG
ncbi:zinc carboxypeptidase [Aureococcus anophagefferens]|nr:zinc carboxypeptidase [Aureococcus anophagefferens]